MNDDIDWNLLAKYLFDECTEEEQDRVRAWMERDPKRISLLRQFRRVLEATEDEASEKSWDTDALWERIREETQPEEDESPPVSPQRNPISSSRSRSRREERSPESTDRRRRLLRTGTHRIWMGVAAALIVMIAVFWMGNYSTTGTLPGSSEEGIETFTTEKGERATVRLSDGTHVRLNVNSRLTVSNSFGDERRRVRLDGEAYFDVATDSTKPFMVHAGGTVTRVLGTAFDVSAYPDEEEAKVIVTEGRVSLQADSGQIGENEDNASREKESVILTERQMARVLNSGGQIIRQKTEGQQHLAWMNGELILNDAPFSKVVRSLERWYDLEIILEEGATPPIGHLNARFAKEQALEEVLTVVATAFRLEYKRHRKRVIFSPSK